MKIFETTVILGILTGKGRKKIMSSSVENTATAVVEANESSLHDFVGVLNVSHVLDIQYISL